MNLAGAAFIDAQLGADLPKRHFAGVAEANHQAIASGVSPYNAPLLQPGVQAYWSIHSTAGLAALDTEINRQAAIQSYLNDFLLIMWVALASMPLLLLLRRAKPLAGPGPAIE